MSSKIRPCMQCGPNSVALRTPSHGCTGCGAFQRSSPTGGAAKGMPRKTRTALFSEVVPSTRPDFVRTGAPVAVATGRRSTATAVAAARVRARIMVGLR